MYVWNFRYLTKRVAEKGYYPFVVIRPENEASHSLYKKLGFRRLYQIVRMSFMPSTWQESEHDANILRDNLENAVRQLNLEQRVITALRDQKENKEETIQDPTRIAESIVEKEENGGEGDVNEEDLLGTIEEQSEERIDTAGDNADDTAADDGEAPEAAQIDDSEDCGTDVAGDDE